MLSVVSRFSMIFSKACHGKHFSANTPKNTIRESYTYNRNQRSIKEHVFICSIRISTLFVDNIQITFYQMNAFVTHAIGT